MLSSLQHIEICVTDLKVAKAFYRSVFSWTTEDASDTYCFFDTGGNPGGAFVLVPETPPGGNVTLFLRARNLQDKLDLVVKNGGQVLKERAPHPVPGHGFFALVADPFGNRLGIWSDQ